LPPPGYNTTKPARLKAGFVFSEQTPHFHSFPYFFSCFIHYPHSKSVKNYSFFNLLESMSKNILTPKDRMLITINLQSHRTAFCPKKIECLLDTIEKSSLTLEQSNS